MVYRLCCLAVVVAMPMYLMITAVPAIAAEAVETVPVIPKAAETQPEAAEMQRVELEKRVVARWNALIRRDFAAAYSFTSPSYRRLFSLDAFRGRFGNKVSWQRVEVVDVEFKGDAAATIGLKVHYTYYPPQAEKAPNMSTRIQESWVLADGQWWYLVQK